ncbi:MAG: T9SS type A sorting domain-containing protein [Flavobacteriales bacterium]|nr:T9SS type A sorting domain-containing protein [Flavobacteriales bacterium]
MKKSLLFIGMSSALLLSVAVQAQTIVSTTAENKNVVLEEFTGIYCTYCPDGHVIAQALKDNNPGDVVLVNVHVGGYAAPNAGSGDPDFRTAFGTSLANQSGLCGYPAGTINRHEFAGMAQTGQGCLASTAMGRDNWTSTAGTTLTESSPVNIGATCELDVLTGIMTFYVEAYYTANSAAATNMLNIAVAENGVKGPQTGAASFNPGNIDANGLYGHHHVLRTFVTGQWGATISTTTSGTLFSDTYTYTVPADYNGIVPNIGNLEVSVYIAEGQEEIITGITVPITYTNVATTNNAAVASVKDLGNVCGTDVSPIVTVQNLGGSNLTTLDITYDVNGGPSSTYGWTGNLGYYGTDDVTLPSIAFTGQGTNMINVSFSNPNGSTDEDTSDDTDNGTFSDAVEALEPVVLTLLLDDYCNETTWSVKASDGTVMASGGPYDCDGQNGGGPDAGTTISETFNLTPDACYEFIISDSYGDGLNAAAFGGTDGTYSLMSSSVVIASGGGSVQFTAESSPFEMICASVTMEFSAAEPTCGQSDGTLSCTVTGSSGPYVYLWSSGQTTSSISGLASGIYVLTITDQAGCVTSETHIVNNVGAAVVSAIATPNVCSGEAFGSVSLTVNGGTAPHSYSWSNGETTKNISQLISGDYSVTVTDAAGCNTFETATITNPSAVTASGSVSNSSGTNGAINLTVSGGTPGYQYTWDNGATTQDLSGLDAGTYTVTIVDAAGCTSSESFTVQAVTSAGSLAPVEAINDVIVYPNPFGHQTTIEFTLIDQENISIDVFSMVGEIVYTVNHGTLSSGTHKVVIVGDDLAPGVYFVRIQVGADSITKKIVHN